MTLKKIVKKLKEEGHKIKFRVRKDGSIIIKKINGKAFEGASGNAVARAMIGASLSAKQLEQRQYNIKKFIKGKRKPKSKITKDVKKLIVKAQREWRKSKTKVNGRITTAKARFIIENEGKEALKGYLSRSVKYAEGYAYSENVNWLIAYIERFKIQVPTLSKDIDELINTIESVKEFFKEDWIYPIYQKFYKVHGEDKEALKNAISATYFIIS